jgi:hypothetical protein
MTGHRLFPCLLAFLAPTFSFAQKAWTDTDRDGLPDDFEQALLVKFLPAFHISKGDCDAAPAEFVEGLPAPVAKTRNGTIYGQVFPVRQDGGTLIEIHYYHLWTRDCGRPGHLLDAESVSGLLQSETGELAADSWNAVFWHAGAHEDTLCDSSNGGQATRLRAVDRGPHVWVSRDKHASFLSKELCALGCGDDRCDLTEPLRTPAILNIGEPGAPMNGADWAQSAAWRLASKMAPHFSDSLIARMPVNEDAAYVPSRQVARGVRTTIKVAGHTYGSLASAEEHAGNAVTSGAEGSATGMDAASGAAATAARHVQSSVSAALASIHKSLKRASHPINGRP